MLDMLDLVFSFVCALLLLFGFLKVLIQAIEFVLSKFGPGNTQHVPYDRDTSQDGVDKTTERYARYTLMGLRHVPHDRDTSRDGKDRATEGYARNTLIGLPTELRIMIYQLALQDNINTIILTASDHEHVHAQNPQRPPLFLGGLALNHTNLLLREESIHIFRPILQAQYDTMRKQYQALHRDAQQVQRIAARRFREGRISDGEKKKRESGLLVDASHNLFAKMVPIHLLIIRPLKNFPMQRT